MHYSNLVIIAAPPSDEPSVQLYVEGAVETAMGPHEDNGGFWDWYQIGGRWSGALDGYEPESDPRNLEPCKFCEDGTTTQAVAARFPAYTEHVGKTCIQCKGKGVVTTWPTQWDFHKGDVVPLASVTPEQYKQFYRVVTPDGKHYGDSVYMPWKLQEEQFVDSEKPPLEWLKGQYPNHAAVVVDNHC